MGNGPLIDQVCAGRQPSRDADPQRRDLNSQRIRPRQPVKMRLFGQEKGFLPVGQCITTQTPGGVCGSESAPALAPKTHGSGTARTRYFVGMALGGDADRNRDDDMAVLYQVV